MRSLTKSLYNAYLVDLMIKWLPFLFCFSYTVSLFAQTTVPTEKKLEYQPTIPFAPKTYVCQQPVDSIIIDGIDKETSWQESMWSSDFVDIEGQLKPIPSLKTNVKMLWDDKYFYVFAKMEEPHIWGKLTERDAVLYHDDDFEVFIDPNGDGHNYYEFEINALNTIWDLFLLWPYRNQNPPNYLNYWNVDGVQHAVHIQGSLNDSSDEDEYWTVEIAIPWSALREMAPNAKPPKSNDQWRINFSRVDWTMEHLSGDYEKVKDNKGKNLPENNWVWTPQGAIAMHMPERWGYVQFDNTAAGEAASVFINKRDEQVKWGLWQLYYLQKEYFKQYGSFIQNIDSFVIPNIEACPFEPRLIPSRYGFQFTNPSCSGLRTWIIDETGKIISVKNRGKHK